MPDDEKEVKPLPDVKIKIVLKVPKEQHDRIVENGKRCGVNESLKKGLENQAYEWLEHIDAFFKDQLPSLEVEPVKTPILGPDGNPMGSG